MLREMDVDRMEAIGRRLADENAAQEMRRREEVEYSTYLHLKRQEANAPYILPVLIIMIVAFCIGALALAEAGRSAPGQTREILHAIGGTCVGIGCACLVVEMSLLDLQC